MNGKSGETRSVLRRQFLLHTPDAFVRTPSPCVANGVTVVHASPRLGADFLQYTAELQAGGTLLPTDAQRFVFTLEGAISLPLASGPALTNLSPSGFIYLPPGLPSAILAPVFSRLMVIEKKYQALPSVPAPEPFAAYETDIPSVPLDGDPRLTVRSLLPSDATFDFAVNIMSYAPGASLAQVEVHHMEHGLLMLEGSGTYRLGDEFHPVHAGDFIWMAPYCPQWFIAANDAPARYLIYKDWNRSPAL